MDTVTDAQRTATAALAAATTATIRGALLQAEANGHTRKALTLAGLAVSTTHERVVVHHATGPAVEDNGALAATVALNRAAGMLGRAITVERDAEDGAVIATSTEGDTITDADARGRVEALLAEGLPRSQAFERIGDWIEFGEIAAPAGFAMLDVLTEMMFARNHPEIDPYDR